MKKRILSLLVCLCLMLSILPAASTAATITNSGTCGANLTWTLDSDGVLTISGTGDMSDELHSYGSTYTGWSEYKQDIRSVVIESGVTSISNSAFYQCFNLSSIAIPFGVTTIKPRAFEECTNLASITLPDSVTTIHDAAFRKCTKLSRINIPYGVTAIAADTFYGCSSLSNIILPDSVMSIGGNAFTQSGLTAITIPNGVATIPGFTFCQCERLTCISLPASIRNISSFAFVSCGNLADVYYDGTNADWNNISIDETANSDLLSATIHYSSGTYTAAISATGDTVTAGDTISVSVNVGSNGIYTDFNAAEIELAYSGNITFNKEASSLIGAEVSVSNGILTLVDKGEAEELGDGVYTLTFTATEAGSATVTLVSAAFGTAEEAETEDLVEATCDTTPVTITITPAVHSVTLPVIFSGSETVANGSSYTFSKETATGAYYNYGTVTATMGGTSVPVTDNGDGTWTIANVTGELVISGSRTEKQYDVTINGETASNDGTQATYNTDYTFTLPADVTAGLAQGYTYALTSVTIDGKVYTGYSVDGKTYTIPGADVVGDVEITITETVLEPNKFTVSVSGSGAGAVVGTYPVTVDKNGSITLTLNPEAGYSYTVSAEGYDVAVSGNTYTISNITGNVTFLVTRSVIIDNVTVSEYVTLNGTSIWLVKNTTEKLEGKLYTYQGQNMFWSKEQGAYCTLVISADKPVPAADDFAIITGAAQELTQGYDVNKTGTVDANDAQLVYNIYMVHYDSFTENVTMEKFLMADTNGDGKIDVNDAAAIVSFLLA